MRHDLPLDSIRVCVVDGTRVYAELLADALKRDERLQVTTVPPDSERLSRCPELANCDVLVISSNLGERPGRGIELLRGLRAVYSGLQAVVLLDGSQNETILEAFRAGARGVFSKNDSVATLSKCIRRVYEGQVWADTGQVNTLLGALASIYEIRAVDARGLDLLSKREMEVVRGVAAGLSNQEIAKRLHLSQHTVKNCLFRVFDKLGVSSRVELLLMTLSGDKDARSAATPFFSHRAYENLRDEGTMAACESAAR
ncbi:MAG TPA: response regulator transcription factor, partial [Terriglobales bacterium]|nr:response regulator transcription factor [Terriglobales bacterium]